MYKIISFFLLMAVNTSAQVSEGNWRAVILNKGGELPFGLKITAVGKDTPMAYHVWVINGTENLKMDLSMLADDSLRIPMDMFDAELIGRVSPGRLDGFYRRKRGKSITQTPFRATFGLQPRFVAKEALFDISGKYATNFISNDGTKSFAVGVFEQKKGKVSGSFLTPTGDYRFLDGVVSGDSLLLSTYDGSHLYLFKARITKNTIEGTLFSGISGQTRFEAVRDASAQLPDERSLTYLKPGESKVAFSFPSVPTKKMVDLEAYKGKVVIIQILGTWCPNCMDETAFLVPWYKKNAARGVEIVGLAFERTSDFSVASPKLQRMIQRYGIPYPVLLAGVADATASAALPTLNGIKGYPTTIFIDKKGNVREIHTGFNGPGTGKYYEEFEDNFNRLVDTLLAEKP